MRAPLGWGGAVLIGGALVFFFFFLADETERRANTLIPRTAPAVPVADGTATPDLPRPRAARTDALLDEEHPWSRACAPAFRAAERASAVR